MTGGDQQLIGAQRPRLRFAPSPTGQLHLGHALSALVNQAFARMLGGQLLIRIEDTDRARCRPEHEVSILDDLAWLGVRSDGPIRRQSEHADDFEAAIARLSGLGLLYPCFATRQQIQAAAGSGLFDPDGAPVYPGLWRGAPIAAVDAAKARDEPYALRLDMGKAMAMARALVGAEKIGFTAFDDTLDRHWRPVRPERWGDVVVRRKEGSAAYHLAVVVDDFGQGITHVVRGADLSASTDVHRLLQVLLGYPPPLYHHHRLILAEDGRKLSKRDGDTSLASLRTQGATPGDIQAMVGLNGAEATLMRFRGL